MHDLTGATLGGSSSSSDSSSSSSIIDGSGGSSSLVEAYDEAVHQLEKFRAQHRGFAQQYIAQFSKKETTGTGGSDFMPALTGYKQTTAAFKLRK
jgi:indoleamine 2,3-dioxygenase